MPKHILWLDNDLPYIRPYVKALRMKDYEVADVAVVSKAEHLLEQFPFDLIILDVMVPTQTVDESRNYSFTETDKGHKTGLVFYKRIRDKMGDKLPTVLVMTVRLDQEIKKEFIKSGLKEENFNTKYSLRDVSKFLKKIQSII